MSETPKDQDLLAPFKRSANLIQPMAEVPTSYRPAVVRTKFNGYIPEDDRLAGDERLRRFAADLKNGPTEAEPQIEQDRRRADWIRDDARAEAVEPRPDYKLFVEAAQYEAIVQENETRKRMCSVQQYMIFGLGLALIAALVWGAQ